MHSRYQMVTIDGDYAENMLHSLIDIKINEITLMDLLSRFSYYKISFFYIQISFSYYQITFMTLISYFSNSEE